VYISSDSSNNRVIQGSFTYIGLRFFTNWQSRVKSESVGGHLIVKILPRSANLKEKEFKKPVIVRT
jgi:hypothetical protein